jgi:hypothetical protein
VISRATTNDRAPAWALTLLDSWHVLSGDIDVDRWIARFRPDAKPESARRMFDRMISDARAAGVAIELARPMDERVDERRERALFRRLDEPTPVTLAWLALGRKAQKRLARAAWDALGVPQRVRARTTRTLMVQHQRLVLDLIAASIAAAPVA